MPGTVTRTPIDQFASSLKTGLEDLGRGFSYFAALPMAIDDLREYVHEPVGALPNAVCEVVGPVRIVLARYLERLDDGGAPVMTSEAPSTETRLRSAYLMDKGATLFFALTDENPSEYHQVFFNTMAHLLSRRLSKETQAEYASLLLAEMEQRVNGEVDEPSWSRKQALPRRASDDQPNTKSKAVPGVRGAIVCGHDDALHAWDLLRHRRGDGSAATAEPLVAQAAGGILYVVPAAGRQARAARASHPQIARCSFQAAGFRIHGVNTV